MESLYKKLKCYTDGIAYPFHMPGHKRNVRLFDKAYSIDMTEIPPFDDLHHPEGVFLRAMEDMAKIYNTDNTYILVNGSTCGILSAISAVTSAGDKILIARNCHKSVYNAVLINQLTPVYVYPKINADFGFCKSVCPTDIKKALEENKDIKAVVITSPTYEGVVSDIKAIADIVHSFNIPLIVDEAHGAHFSFGNEFPKSAISCGADIVIHSLHKTLPALTQTALLHTKSDIVNKTDVERYLRIYQSSSPSYILTSSSIECVSFMENEGTKLLSEFGEKLSILRSKIKRLDNINLYSGDDNIFDYDISKLIFSVKGLSGVELIDLLREKYGLVLEMASGNYVIAMTSLCDTQIGFDRLYEALVDIDKNTKDAKNEILPIHSIKHPEYKLPPHKAVFEKSISLPYEKCNGLICRDTMYVYPPGIPLIVSGEKVNSEIIESIRRFEDAGLTIHADDYKKGFMNILED